MGIKDYKRGDTMIKYALKFLILFKKDPNVHL